MDKLPQELINTIIGHLHDEPRTLRVCSLVCSSLLHTSQRHFFRRIVLLPPNARYGRRGDISYSQRLHWLLLRSPHIATYIQELRVHEGQIHREQDWIGTDQTLAFVLGKLTHLRRIELRRLQWNVLPPDLRRSICNVLELPSLVFVEMEHSNFASVDDFSNILSHAEGLTGLSLTSISTSYFGGKPLQDRSQLTEQKERGVDCNQCRHLLDLYLKLYGYPKFFDWLLGPQSPSDVSHIRTLHISNFNQSEADAVNRLLHAIGNSLRHFQINVPHWLSSGLPSIHFDLCPLFLTSQYNHR
jgi:hypothetical protein